MPPVIPSFVARPVPQRPAVPDEVYEDLLQRIFKLLTGNTIKRDQQALQKHLSAMDDMHLDVPVI